MEKTIEKLDEGRNPWAVYEHSTYGPESVNEGMPKRVFKGSYPTPEDALKDHPDAEVVDFSTKVDYSQSDVPPRWFDPNLAGEEW